MKCDKCGNSKSKCKCCKHCGSNEHMTVKCDKKPKKQANKHLLEGVKRAKEIRRTEPGMTWTDAIKKAFYK